MITWTVRLVICLMAIATFNNVEAKHFSDFFKKKEVSFKVYPKDYTFSRVFDFISKESPVGSVIKSSLHVRTHYDLYSAKGDYEGQGICKILCLGAIYVWGTEIDLYDSQGNPAGFIDGQVVTTEPAKFSLYDRFGHRVAIAYLDEDSRGFSLVHPENTGILLARLTRKFLTDMPDYWTVHLYEPEIISEQMIKIFAAFVCDRQGSFREDN